MSKASFAALNEMMRQYPAGIASLFEGAGVQPPVNGAELLSALKNEVVSYDDLYGVTMGAYSDASGQPKEKKEKERGRFWDALDRIVNAGSNVADVYQKFKNPSAPSVPSVPSSDTSASTPSVFSAGSSSGSEKKKFPWAIIAGVGAVVVLIVVLLMMKKK